MTIGGIYLRNNQTRMGRSVLAVAAIALSIPAHAYSFMEYHEDYILIPRFFFQIWESSQFDMVVWKYMGDSSSGLCSFAPRWRCFSTHERKVYLLGNIPQANIIEAEWRIYTSVN